MAKYTPDHEYLKAKKIVEELGDSEKDEAIKYYIKKHNEWYDELNEKLKRYSDFFETLNSLLPKSGRFN